MVYFAAMCRDHERDGRAYMINHGGVAGGGRDINHAPLHGGSGRLAGMGYSHHASASSPEMRGYHHPQDMRWVCGLNGAHGG